MTKEEMLQAAQYWERRDAKGKKMPDQLLLANIASYIVSHNTCALATGARSFVRCTPIEYSYKDGCFWLFSEGGMKFLGLSENSNVSLAIYDAYTGFGSVSGMQVTGIAEMVEPWSKEYMDLLAFKKIPAESLKKQASILHLIKIVPKRIDFLSSELKKQGYDSRQCMMF